MYRIEEPRGDEPMMSTDAPWAVNRVSHNGVIIDEFKETGETLILAPVSNLMRGASGTDIRDNSDECIEETERTLFLSGCFKRPRGWRFLIAERENVIFGGIHFEQIAERTVILAK